MANFLATLILFLNRNLRAYSKFVQRMHGVGLVDYSLHCECELDVFFVHKKSGKIRLILDCRRANARFRSPPATELLRSEGFSNIEFDGTGSDKTDLEQLRLYLGVGDVADCFHRMRLKGSIRRFFCWPSLSAASLGIQEVDGQRVEPERRVWPMANSLPMGWSWSLYFAQKANLRRVSSVGLLSKSVWLTDRGKSAVLKPRGKGVTSHYVYVDIFGIQSVEEQAAKEGLDAVTTAFEEEHLKKHETEVQCEKASALRSVLDGGMLETRAREVRLRRVRSAIGTALRRRRMSGRQLEILLAHVSTWLW